MGSIILLVMVVFIRFMARDYAGRSRSLENPATTLTSLSSNSPKGKHPSVAQGSSTHDHSKSKRIAVNPCEGSPSIEMSNLMDADLKNDEVYFKQLMNLFDHLDSSLENFFDYFDSGGLEKDLDCVPVRDEISKIEYMISQRDGRDPKVKKIILTRYKAIAYAILDHMMETKREYYSMAAVSGIFMNLEGKHFYTPEQETELRYIYQRVRDDFKAFRYQKDKKEKLDKNGAADRILLRDWMGSLE